LDPLYAGEERKRGTEVLYQKRRRELDRGGATLKTRAAKSSAALIVVFIIVLSSVNTRKRLPVERIYLLDRTIPSTRKQPILMARLASDKTKIKHRPVPGGDAPRNFKRARAHELI